MTKPWKVICLERYKDEKFFKIWVKKICERSNLMHFKILWILLTLKFNVKAHGIWTCAFNKIIHKNIGCSFITIRVDSQTGIKYKQLKQSDLPWSCTETA